MRQPKFNRERMLKIVEDGLNDGDNREEDDLTSDEREPIQEPLQDPARESEPNSKPPETVPPPAAVTQDEFDYKASHRELIEMNKQLMQTVHQLSQQRVSQPEPTRERGFTGAPPAPEPVSRNPDDLAVFGDFEPILNELSQVKAYTSLFVNNEQERVEQDAHAAFARLRAKHGDAEELIDPQLFATAILGAKQRAAEALKQGKRFTFDWDKNLQAEYDTADAPRLRSREQKRLEEEAAKAKQQEELQKVSGMPSRGARYQGAEESGKKRTELKAGQSWKDRLRESVTKRLSGMQE